MTDDLAGSLQTHFGFTAFRPGQAEALEKLLIDRQDTLVVMPTGSGKSLIYQLAALQLPGQTLVISPLIALMKDQVDHLSRHSIPATYINSTLSTEEQNSRLSRLAQGEFRLAYVAPERLRSVPFQRVLDKVSIDLLAVDEAHCISQWGHDFRPDYLHLVEARKQMGNPLTVALTATATPAVQNDIIRALGLETAGRIVTGFNRSNLTFELRYTSSLPAKYEALQQLLIAIRSGAAIVYVGTRRDAEEVADFLRTVVGLEARYYHAGLQAEQRASVQDAFLSGRLSVVTATNAFGMGIDRPDVRLVVHFNMPGTLEAYYQEAGRAGRDGLPAQAVLLYSPEDRALQEWFIENGTPSLGDLYSLYQFVKAVGRSQIWASAEQLSLSSGLPEVKVKVALAQLEEAGALKRLGDEGTRMLLTIGHWDEAALQAGASLAGQRRQYRQRQLMDMIAYAETNQCRRRVLLEHFGDHAPADAPLCCDNCLSRASAVERPVGSPNEVPNLSQAERGALVILDALNRLKWGVGRTKLAQLLKGSRAKDMARFGYDKNAYYGCMAVYTQAEIDGLIQQLLRQNYLKAIGGDQPVLRLTPRGEVALKTRAAIPLDLPRVVSARDKTRKQAERDAGGTVELTAQLFAQGFNPAQIAAQRGLIERTVYGHLAQLIGQGRTQLSAVVPDDVALSVQRAIEEIGDVFPLSALKAGLPDDISYEHIRCVVEDWSRSHGEALAPTLKSSSTERMRRVVELGDLGSPAGVPELIAALEDSDGNVRRLAASALGKIRDQQPATENSIAEFLSQSRPRPLPGTWDLGWALGDNSRFLGAHWSRSMVGELTYQLKYRGDLSTVSPLVDHILSFFADQPEFAAVDVLVPVPPTVPRPVEPVGVLAEALAVRLMLPVWTSVLVKTRLTAPQKDMHTLAQKRANVAGAFAVRGDVRDKRLLVLDDLFDSGATLEEISKVLRGAGAARLHVLTLTRTIHTAA